MHVIACLHGNEQYGLEVGKNLPPFFSFLIGNPKAIKKNKRYIDADLNRVFPGNKKGNYEQRRAYELTKQLKNQTVIDLHSTSEKCELFGILTKTTNMKLASRLGLKKAVIMPQEIAKGKSLIDNVKQGISIEVGPHKRKENAEEALNCIKHYLKRKHSKPTIYYAFTTIKKENKNSKVCIRNFQTIKKGQIIATKPIQKAKQAFTAILAGEQAYTGLICIAAKRKAKTYKLIT
ncbi:succinylglutamate desuccinylase/aspartoacylase family protein [Candidatus Woesearchaeota archaeon]|nr:succinylglutamate desuccinylase/aspartoacylase family protein [Candidatus Woesearchaeota archaeon]